MQTATTEIYTYCHTLSLHDALPISRTVAMPCSSHRYREDDACLISGMSSHILDYDDVSMLAVCHPSVPVLTALLALLEETGARSEEHTSELQSLMRITYAVFCL